MFKKLPPLDKIYWENLFYYFLIYSGATLLASVGTEDQPFDIHRGLAITAVMAVLGLGHVLALHFMTNARESDRRDPEKPVSALDLMPAGIKYMQDGGKMSPSALQREFKIPYNTAAELHNRLMQVVI